MSKGLTSTHKFAETVVSDSNLCGFQLHAIRHRTWLQYAPFLGVNMFVATPFFSSKQKGFTTTCVGGMALPRLQSPKHDIVIED